MERQYYVEREHETAETSDRMEAARIAAEWEKRGYAVQTVVVDVTRESVQVADNTEGTPAAGEWEVRHSRKTAGATR